MKKFLSLPGSLTVILMIVSLVLLTATAGFAATKTWAGGNGTGKDWTAGANWSGGTIPAANDDIVFNTAGTITFSVMPAANIGFNSLTISQGTVIFVNGAARVLTIGGNAGVDLSIASGATLTIGNNVTITLLDAATTANITGALTLQAVTPGTFTTAANSTVTYNGAAQNIIGASFANLTLAGTNTKTLLGNTTVNGALTINAGVTLAMAAFTVGSPTSLVLQSGTTASAITGTGLITLGGDITVNFTGAGTTAATVGPPVTFGVDRQFNVDAGAGLTMNGIISNPGVPPTNPPFGPTLTITGTGTITFNAANTFRGDFVLSGGTVVVGNVKGLGPDLNPNTTNRVLTLNGGTVILATNTTVDPYTFWIGDDVNIVSDRASSGAGVNHMLAGLTFATHTLTVTRGANVTGGSPALTFQNVILYGGGVLNTGNADVFISGVVAGFDFPWKFTKTGAGTLTKTGSDWELPGDFQIDAGTYDQTTRSTSLAGNWINNGGTLTGTGAAKVVFNGTSAQTIGGSVSTTFSGLEVNNAAGVSLTTVNENDTTLTLTNGRLTIPTGRTLTIANGTPIGGSPFTLANSIVTQSDPGSTAKGFVTVNNIVNAAVYTIPTSDGTNYLPVTLTPTEATANNDYSVCVFTGITANGERNGTPFTASQKNTCVDAVWFVNHNVASVASTTVTVGWPVSLEGTKFQGFSNIGIAHWDGPNWGIPVGTGTHGSATRTAVTAFSPFGVGNPAFLVLATKITYFNAAKGNGYNTVNWQAACSSSQATFEVLRSTDGRNFSSINSLTASQARCAQPFNFQDNTAPQGVVYYRLKVIDVDGKESLSGIVKISSEIKAMELAGIAPNPVSNVAQLKINASKVGVVNLTIISTEGQVVYRNSIQLQPGSSVVNLDIAKLPAGVYMIKGMFSDGETNTVKFVKQ